MTEPTRAASPAALRDLVGVPLGTSSWREIDQAMVDAFADVTGDHQWIHVDPVRAADGPFGGTVAHGYLTLSLAPILLSELLVVDGARMGVNYGLNKVRFPSPVRVGDAIRASAVLDSAEEIEGGIQAEATLTVQTRRSSKPACVAQIVFRYYS